MPNDAITIDRLKSFVEASLQTMIDGGGAASEFGVGYCMAVLDLAWTLQVDNKLAVDAAAALGFKRSPIDFDPNLNPFLPKEVRK